MNEIGKIIKKIRKERQMSPTDLAEGICSTEYIYMIEAEKRRPSLEILQLICNRLNVDFIDYFPYLDNKEVKCVKETVEKIEDCRTRNDYEQLSLVIDEASSHDDFKVFPGNHIINLNRIIIVLALEENLEKAYALLQEGFESLGIKEDIEEYENLTMIKEDNLIIRYYNMLAIYYTKAGDITTAHGIYKKAQEIMESLKDMSRASNFYIRLTRNLIYTTYLSGNYEKCLELSLNLLEYQFATNSLVQVHTTYYIIAIMYKAIGRKELAIEYMRKSMYLFIGLNDKTELQFLQTKVPMSELLSDLNIEFDLLEEFMKY